MYTRVNLSGVVCADESTGKVVSDSRVVTYFSTLSGSRTSGDFDWTSNTISKSFVNPAALEAVSVPRCFRPGKSTPGTVLLLSRP